jgi:hypothetical protein
MEPRSERHAEIAFERPEAKGDEPRLRLTGVPTELARSPEKIRELMELLELPEGTNAHVTIATSSVIIR